jgi:hypothetical protein
MPITNNTDSQKGCQGELVEPDAVNENPFDKFRLTNYVI